MPDCLVLGGGIIGLSIAEQLTRLGQSVRLVTPFRIRQTASWAAAGILPPPSPQAHDAVEQLRMLSQRLYPSWCDRLSHESGLDVGYRPCGGLYLSRRPGESAALRATMDQLQREGGRVEAVDRNRLTELEPGLTVPDDLRCTYLLPEEAQVRPSRLLKALRAILSRRGVEFVDEVQILGWTDLGKGRAALRTNLGRWNATWICVAAGPWSTALLHDLGRELPVEPRRGQIVAWQTSRPLLQRIVNEGPRYLVPRPDGWLLAGSTVEEVGFDGSTTSEGIDELVTFARGWLPALRDMPLRDAWAGLRPYSRDGRPHLGRLAPWENVLVAAGHFRSGIHLAPATAQILAELILGHVPQIDLSPFAPRPG